jgi:calcineurin-like phosphoesterase family protein
MVYIWSDLHLGHANIIKYCDHPFADAEAMNKALFHAWRVYEGKYILSHDIVEAAKNSPFVNIHGHFHQHTMDHPRYVNVCVEMTGYKPVPLEAVAIAP